MGLFITFEGIEGCGKTTQLRLAGEYLASCAIPFVATVEPGGTSLGSRIREILLNKSPEALCAKAELLLFCAARAQHLHEVIMPALASGNVVLCDRFSDATIVYQGYGRGLDVAFIKTLTDFSAGNRQPDLTFLFDLEVEEGLARAFDRMARRPEAPAEDRFEREDLTFHHRVREGYLLLARENPARFRVIDASRGIESVRRDVCGHLQAMARESGHGL